MSRIIMAVVPSNAGRWSYCPLLAVPVLEMDLEYGESEYPTASDAITALKRDKTVPRNVEVRTFDSVKAAMTAAAQL